MITKEGKIEEMCSFYVSDYHFEMIILPYINKKMEENYKIEIISQNNLESSIKILLEKINLNDSKKRKIINLNWNNSKYINLKNNEKEVIVIKGTEEFVNNTSCYIKNNLQNKEIILINCFDIEEVNMEILAKKYRKILNILGEKEF